MLKLVFRDSDGLLVGEERVFEKSCYLVSNDKNGILAEIQVNGTSKLGRILGIKQETNDDNDNDDNDNNDDDKKKKKKKKKKTNDGNSNRLRPPRLIVKLVDAAADADANADANAPPTQIIDVGQITTVWTLLQRK